MGRWRVLGRRWNIRPARERQVDVRVLPTIHATEESIALAREIFREVYKKVPEKVKEGESAVSPAEQKKPTHLK
jgi:hypothetical protein